MPIFDIVKRVIVALGESTQRSGLFPGIITILILASIAAVVVDNFSSQETPITSAGARVTKFVPLGPQQYPSPSPKAVFVGRTPDGKHVFAWAGRRWSLPSPPPPNQYAYLCVASGLRWCRHNPPNATAQACTRKGGGIKGWCWEDPIRTVFDRVPAPVLSAASATLAPNVEKACRRFPNLC